MSDVSHPVRHQGVPKAVLVGAAALLVFALSSTLFTRVSDIGALHMPAASAVETLPLRFEDRADGAIVVRNAATGATIHVVAPGEGGFIRATMRGLARERLREGLGDETPFLLTHWSDGTASLRDEATGRAISLDAFGPTNAGAFAQLFAAHGGQP